MELLSTEKHPYLQSGKTFEANEREADVFISRGYAVKKEKEVKQKKTEK